MAPLGMVLAGPFLCVVVRNHNGGHAHHEADDNASRVAVREGVAAEADGAERDAVHRERRETVHPSPMNSA